MYFLASFIGTVFAVMAAAEFVPGFYVANVYTAAIVAILLGLIGITFRPILLLLTLPINLLTFGLFSFVINAGIIWFLSTFVDGFSVGGFIPALLGGIVIALIQWVIHRFV